MPDNPNDPTIGQMFPILPTMVAAWNLKQRSAALAPQPPSPIQPLVGVSAAGTVGSVNVAGNPTLVGVSATGSVGSVVVASNPALVGVSAVGSVGSVGVDTGTQVRVTQVVVEVLGLSQSQAGRPIYIGGVVRDVMSGWTITLGSNAVGRMAFRVASRDGSYIPALDDEVIMTENGVRIFAGTVQTVRTMGVLNEGGTPTVAECSALDFNFLTTLQYFGGTIPSSSLKSLFTLLMRDVPNVVIDAGQVTGPSIPALVYTARKIKDILDSLTQQTGYIWEVDFYRIARMYLPGTIVAPFNIAAGDGNAIGDVTSEPSRATYANIVLVFGTGFVAQAQNNAEIAAHGNWVITLNSPDSTTQALCDALAIGALAASLPVPRVINYVTYRSGLFPGMAQTITIPNRGIGGSYFITNVVMRDLSPTLIEHRITAIEGTAWQPGWREKIKQLGGPAGGFP